jgi:hypothetical protein
MSENSEFIPADDEQETLENRVIQFNINDAAIAEVKEDLGEVDAYKDLDHAKAAKKTLTKMRTTLADAHKEAKAEALAYGRRCDAEKNRLLASIAEIEDPITKQLDDIKNAAAKAEEERVAGIMAKIEQIQAFALDRHDLTLDQLNERLSTLLSHPDPSEEDYDEFAEDGANAKEVSESKLRIAIMNEEARLKEAEEQERIRKENEELKEKLAKQEAEQAERDAEAKKIADAEAEEQRKKDAERQAELDAQQKAIDDENARLAQEKADKEAAEAAEEAAKIAALQAPDAEKLALYAADIHTLIENRPVLQSDAGNNILLDVTASLIQVEEFIHSKREEL